MNPDWISAEPKNNNKSIKICWKLFGLLNVFIMLILLNIDPNNEWLPVSADLDGWESACINKINPYGQRERKL